MLIRALIAHEPSAEQERVKRLAGGPGILLSSLGKEEGLWERIGTEPFDVVITPRRALPEPLAETLKAIQDLPAPPDVVVLDTAEDADEHSRLLAGGCSAVLDLALADEALRESLHAFFERRREGFRLRLLAPEGGQRLGDFVSASTAMKQLLSVARKVTESDTTLLLLGETGVGKEWLARAIHAGGPRAAGPFIAVNCGAIPEGLLESELFGHKKGSFTGATSDRRGHFELAHGGTLFLDEIGEMSSQVQVKLLRVLQERAIQAVGSERSIEVDVRVMAATNRDPQIEMEEGRLRRDLYYRLGVVTLAVPPLRERREDILDLVENYFEIYRTRLGRDIYGIDREAMRTLVAYDWPGNVRELINVMERAVLLCEHEEIAVADLPEAITGRRRFPAPAGTLGSHGLDERLDETWLRKPLREARREVAAEFERLYLSALLARTGGKIGETARQAGMSPRALFDRMQRLGLSKEDFKPAPSAEPRR